MRTRAALLVNTSGLTYVTYVWFLYPRVQVCRLTSSGQSVAYISSRPTHPALTSHEVLIVFCLENAYHLLHLQKLSRNCDRTLRKTKPSTTEPYFIMQTQDGDTSKLNWIWTTIFIEQGSRWDADSYKFVHEIQRLLQELEICYCLYNTTSNESHDFWIHKFYI